MASPILPVNARIISTTSTLLFAQAQPVPKKCDRTYPLHPSTRSQDSALTRRGLATPASPCRRISPLGARVFAI